MAKLSGTRQNAKRPGLHIRAGFTGAEVESTLRRFDLPSKAAHAITSSLQEVVMRHLKAATKRAFPGSGHTVRRSLFVTTRRGRGEAGRLPFVLAFGMRTKGISDADTGKPLSSYIRPLQAFERVTVASPPKSSRIRTAPPELFKQVGGRQVASGVVSRGIKPWVERTLGKSGADAWAIAIAIAKKFERQGMPRQPIISQLIRPVFLRSNTPVSLVDAATDHYGFKTAVIRALRNARKTLKKQAKSRRRT